MKLLSKSLFWFSKKKILTMFFVLPAICLFAQTDTIFIKRNQQVLCSNIKETETQYSFTFINANNMKEKSTIPKYLVDSVKYFKLIVDSTKHTKVKKKLKIDKQSISTPETVSEQVSKQKSWQFSTNFGINLGNVLELNNSSSSDKKSFTFSTSLDLGLNYKKQGKKFEMTNELHYQLSLQKEGVYSGTHIQRVQDALTTLHDLSFGINKNNKWNFNVILKTATSIFTIYDGDYFSNINNLGKIQSFASPYDITVSPGIKYEPNQHFRISLSPFAFQLYGIQNKEITDKGIFITEKNGNGEYKNFLFNRLGSEVNFWYDSQVGNWLEMQYRIGFSSNYFTNFGNNGLMDGLFISKIKIIKDIYLTHRATIKNNLSANFLKPYFNQLIMLSYAKSF